MIRVTWMQSAIADLNDIDAYLTGFGPAVAKDTIDRSIVAAARLLDFRSAGAPFRYRRWRTWRPRKTRYILAYAPISDGIVVVRVRPAQQDWRAVID